MTTDSFFVTLGVTKVNLNADANICKIFSVITSTIPISDLFGVNNPKLKKYIYHQQSTIHISRISTLD